MPFICTITKDQRFKAYVRPHNFDNHLLTYDIDGVILGVAPREYVLHEETMTVQTRKVEGNKVLFMLIGEQDHDGVWLRISNVPRTNFDLVDFRRYLKENGIWDTITQIKQRVNEGKIQQMFDTLTTI